MENEILIDGKNATMGRLASYAAKQALLGKKIAIVNASDVIIIGSKKNIVDNYKRKIKMGGNSMKGPNIIRSPERILKRAIRGMLKHKRGRGGEAYKKIKCYNEIPEEYSNAKKIVAGREKNQKSLKLKELCNLIK